jgi:hypothetical protein
LKYPQLFESHKWNTSMYILPNHLQNLELLNFILFITILNINWNL